MEGGLIMNFVFGCGYVEVTVEAPTEFVDKYSMETFGKKVEVTGGGTKTKREEHIDIIFALPLGIGTD